MFQGSEVMPTCRAKLCYSNKLIRHITITISAFVDLTWCSSVLKKSPKKLLETAGEGFIYRPEATTDTDAAVSN